MTKRTASRAALATLGCRVNFSETDRLRGQLQQAGYQLVDLDQTADVYIVNTCTVTHVADRKSRQLLRRAARQHPGALVVAVGCYADVSPQALQQIEAVGLILNQEQEDLLVDRIAVALRERGLEPPTARQSAVSSGAGATTMALANPARALVKVQDGCDNRCTYCIVTIARGPSRSRPAGDILNEIRQLERAGHSEIILTGINLGVYQDGQGGNLAGLTRRVLEETDIERIRFSSIEPQCFPLNLLDLWPNPRLCRHFHLPIQSGSDRILAQMGRKYRLADYRVLVEQIRRRTPNIALTTDVIVGFPGETDTTFAESIAAIANLSFSDLHVFPFSARPGTAAATMPHPVPAHIRQDRCQQMHQLARNMARSFRQRFLGHELAVHWEGQRGQEWSGLSDNYLRVVATSTGNWLDQITRTHIQDLDETVLRGQILGPVPYPVRIRHAGQIASFVV